MYCRPNKNFDLLSLDLAEKWGVCTNNAASGTSFGGARNGAVINIE